MSFFGRLFTGEPDMDTDTLRWLEWVEKQVRKIARKPAITEILKQEGLTYKEFWELYIFVLRSPITSGIARRVLSNTEHSCVANVGDVVFFKKLLSGEPNMYSCRTMWFVSLFLVITVAACQQERPATEQKKEGTQVVIPTAAPMDDLVRALAYDVFDLLQDYIQVHNDMIARERLAYLKPINFEGNALKLSQISQALQRKNSQALSLQRSPQALARHKEYLRNLVSYVEALSDTVNLLHDVTSKLSQMAHSENRDYTMSQFLEDMDNYKTSAEHYRASGEILKKAWDKAGL